MSIDIEASLAAAKRQNAQGCVKTDEDLARYERVIKMSRPDGIIEIGTFSGKSALWFARTAKAPVFTVDVAPQVDPEIYAQWAEQGVTGHVGRSDNPHTAWQALEWLRRWKVNRPMVVLDGDHSGDTVLGEMNLYGRWVKPGGYMVVEDGLVRWMPWEQVEGGGPYRGSPLDAIEAFMRMHHRRWEIDTATEGMSTVTQFPSGWLRRWA